MTEQEKLFTFAYVVALIGMGAAIGALFGSLTASAAERRGHSARKWFWLGATMAPVAMVLFHFAGAVWALVGLLANLLPMGVLYLIEPGPNAQRRQYTPGDKRRLGRAIVTLLVGALVLAIVWLLFDGRTAFYWAVLTGFVAGWVTKLVMLDGNEQRQTAIKSVVVAAGAAIGLAAGWLISDLSTGVAWAILGAVLAILILVVVSLVTDRLEPDPSYTPSPDRPETPRRVITLLPALVIIVLGLGLGGWLFGDLAGGALWGVVGAAGVIAAIWAAREKIDPLGMGVAVAGMVVSAVLAVIVIPEVPETLSANLSLRMAGAWIPAGLAMGYLAWRKHDSLVQASTTVLGWAGAGLLVLPAAVSWDVLEPVSYLVRDAEVGSVPFWFIGVAMGILGGAFTLSGISGLNSLATMATVLFMTVYAAAQVGFTVTGLSDKFAETEALRRNMWPPDFEWAIGTGSWWDLTSWDFGHELRDNPLIETFRIAIIACLIGVTIAIPLALRASRITAIRGSDYWLNKGFMNVVRTVPDLFWAMIFAASVGLGPFAGALALIVFSMAIMAKLLSETVDAVDPRPIEAARATGSHHWPAIRTSVWPQVLPNYVAYALYIFEINIRASVVLGIVGAGGIGRVLEAQRSFFKFDRVLAIVIVIFVIVFLIEQVSVALRRRLV